MSNAQILLSIVSLLVLNLGNLIVGEVKIKSISAGYQEIWGLRVPVGINIL